MLIDLNLKSLRTVNQCLGKAVTEIKNEQRRLSAIAQRAFS